MACQPPTLPSSRQTKGMDASQTEFLNLDCIKGLNRKSQSTGENVNELHNPTLSERTTSEGSGEATCYSFSVQLLSLNKYIRYLLKSILKYLETQTEIFVSCCLWVCGSLFALFFQMSKSSESHMASPSNRRLRRNRMLKTA